MKLALHADMKYVASYVPCQTTGHELVVDFLLFTLPLHLFCCRHSQTPFSIIFCTTLHIKYIVRIVLILNASHIFPTAMLHLLQSGIFYSCQYK